MLLREIHERGYTGWHQPTEGLAVAADEDEVEPLVRFERPSGQQMQAGFTYVRRKRDPLLALVATLGYSRASYVKFVACSGEDVATLCAGLREAFDCFGGTAKHILFDNTKAVVIERDAYSERQHRWNAELREVAESCGCAAPVDPRRRARSSAPIPTSTATL